MRSVLLLVIFCLFITTSYSQHTFSIVAVDSITGEIGSAGATCISQEDGAITISDIVLGVGAIHTQSYWVPANQSNARTRMEAGDSPQEIMDWLVQNDVNNDPSLRQYGVVDLNNGNPRSAAYTGNNCFAEFLHITGPNYAIQGNILISESVITDMETAFVNTEGILADKLMAAMQAAKRPGADSRCLNFGVSSASAFIRVASPTDTDSGLGNLSLDLNVWIATNIFEPIDALQDMYNATLSVTNLIAEEDISLSPNPVSDLMTIQLDKNTPINGYEIFTVNGELVEHANTRVSSNVLVLNAGDLSQGVYFINLLSDSKMVGSKRFVVID